jgi:hypothetical protein
MSARQWCRALGFVCGFVLATAAVKAWTPVNGLSYLTFNRSVALPGVTLPAGTYAFEIVNPTSGADVVVVHDRARSRLYFSGMTNGIQRPDASRRDGAVMFGEAGTNEPVPIVAWFPTDSAHGRLFIYRR